MLCISVTPSSRTLAPADMLNASRKCELIELCLDHFIRQPDVADLLKLTDRPVLISCRREKDGGTWTGTEEERLNVLRNAIVAGPAYVEIELDIADQIPRFGDVKRVISYTSLNRPLSNIDEVFERCWKAKADVVKVTWPTDDFDAAWPLLAAVSQSRELPVVGQGIGRSGLTFSLLGRRYGSPWIYAALEQGMEAYDGQPSVWQLEEEYGWEDIGKGTRFVGVVGRGRTENSTVRVLNAAFRRMKKPIRCLPLIPGQLDRLQKRLAQMKINALLVDPLHDSEIAEMCVPADNIATRSGYVDLAMAGSQGWRGKSTLFDAVQRVADELRGERWAAGRATTVFGSGPLAQAALAFFNLQNSAVSVAAPSDNDAVRMAKSADARHIPWSAIHSVATDVVVLADANLECGVHRQQVNPSLIREGMTVIDLSRFPVESEFAEECHARGAHYVSPQAVFRKHLSNQFRLLTRSELPPDVFETALPAAAG